MIYMKVDIIYREKHQTQDSSLGMYSALLMMQLTSARAIKLMLSTSVSNKTVQYNYFGIKSRHRT